MTKLFNYVIQNGVFPHDWKVAKVIPLHKKGPKSMLDNYRPISILPAVSKAFESILYDQLYGYLSNAGILSKYQFGFRRCHSKFMALLDIYLVLYLIPKRLIVEFLKHQFWGRCSF